MLFGVGNILTAPDHHRRGGGVNAPAAFVNQLVEHNTEAIELNAELANQPAIGMHLSLDFVPDVALASQRAIDMVLNPGSMWLS